MKIAIRFDSFCILVLFLLVSSGCGKNPEHVESPDNMIGDLARIAGEEVSWEILSERGLRVVDSVFAETNTTERGRLVKALRQTMRTLRRPRDREDRRRRIWALKDMCLRMRGCWGRLGKPEEAVEDWLFVLSQYREELKRLGPVDHQQRVYLQSIDEGALCHKAYDNVMCDLICDAESFENIVLPNALPGLTVEERQRIEGLFTEIVGRKPHVREQ